MSTEENKALVRRWEELWNQANLALAEELFAPTFLLHDPSSPVEIRGPEGYKQDVLRFRSVFPDLHITLEDLIAEGEKVVARWTASGTHTGPLRSFPPTGRRVRLTGIDIFHIEDGKIAEEWSNADGLGMLQQLGVVPAPGQAS
jgi:steroid delta-isomerase-like uncharacterized protein